jgi:hypothetical protein
VLTAPATADTTPILSSLSEKFQEGGLVNRRGVTLSLAAAAGDSLAAAFVPTAVASADIVDLFTPDTSTFDPTTGAEDWNYTGFTTGPAVGSDIDYLQFGGGFANEFVYEPGVSPAITDLLITLFGDVTLLG